ncbi:MAG: hypothetical protein DRJ31_00455 [Candidatus Methanomethylicota archaeon]|uniref:Major facilitator superfamily (MFS) profile domain-containing protein n=1 Tax=Thermoproteota archaeon TaxID=2056631 RepID=A0A497ETI2_9CREN|nr:MAG: hypothetical protein DRJ31_00455 [Candidatus Verstraetearchaeota archaeon]
MIFLLFSIVDGIQQIFIVRSYGMETLRVIGLIEFGVALPIMVLGGWFIDHYGRRPSYAFSFACVGFAYLTLGALPKCWFLYAILDGIGWALLTVCFILVIWGDIAYGVSRSVYIAICLASALILSGLRDFIAPLVPHYTFLQALAIALFFLFIAAVFVVTAPETLPEEILEARRVKRYIRAALKVKEEFEKRGS